MVHQITLGLSSVSSFLKGEQPLAGVRWMRQTGKKHLVAVPSVTPQKRLPQLKARLGLVSESGPNLHSTLALENLESYTPVQEEEISYLNLTGFEESPGAPGQEGV